MEEKKVPLQGIWSDSFTTVTSEWMSTRPADIATVGDAVTQLSHTLVDKINSNYSLDPPFTIQDIQHNILPVTAKSTDPMLSLEGKGSPSLTAVFCPKDAERTGKHWREMKDEMKELKEKNHNLSIAAEQQTSSGPADFINLQRGVAELQAGMEKHKAEQDQHKAEQDQLKAELKKEREDRRAEIAQERAEREKVIINLTQLTAKLIPLHLRALLDLTRNRIVSDMELNSWDDLYCNQKVYEVPGKIIQALRLAQPGTPQPSREAIEFLCAYNNVRKAGNVSAHNASEDEIREAILSKPLGQERCFLAQLFRFTFKCPV